MPSENGFDCRATAAVLRSGSSLALAGHAAAIMSVLCIMGRGGAGEWLGCLAILNWCAVVYLAIRVKIDAAFFELLADHSAEQLDAWLKATGLREETTQRTLAERRAGGLRLWRRLGFAVAIQIALLLLALVSTAIGRARLLS